MAGKGITYATKLGGMAGSLTVFLCCANIFVRTKGEIDLSTLFYAIKIVVPAGFVVGYLAYRIGKIFDGTKKKKKLNKFMK